MIFTRIKAMLYGWKKQPDIEEIENLCDFYRYEILNRRVIRRYLGKKELMELIRIARYADMGLMTAIQAAFCLGYDAGKER